MTRPRSPDLGPGLGSSPPTTQMRLWEMVENSKKHDFQTSRRAFAQELRLLSPQKGLDRHTRSQDDPQGFHHPLAFICTPNIPQNKMVAIYGIMPEWKMEKQANRAAAGIFGTQTERLSAFISARMFQIGKGKSAEAANVIIVITEDLVKDLVGRRFPPLVDSHPD